MFVNASPQRREVFDTIQQTHSKKGVLRLLQDVKTRWNSTCHMLIRARKLKDTIQEYTRTSNQRKAFRLSEEEWLQVEYLIDLTKPFNFHTTMIGQLKGPTISHVYRIYDSLFTHLESSLFKLTRKKVRARGSRQWINPMVKGLDSALDKLQKYYQETYSDIGSLYALGTMLSPIYKTTLFDKDQGFDDGTDWCFVYKEQMRRLYQKGYSRLQSSSQKGVTRGTSTDWAFLTQIDKFNPKPSSTPGSVYEQGDECDRYLDGRKFVVIFIVISC